MHTEAFTKFVKWRGKELFKKISNKGGFCEWAPKWVTEEALYIISLSQSWYTPFDIWKRKYSEPFGKSLVHHDKSKQIAKLTMGRARSEENWVNIKWGAPLCKKFILEETEKGLFQFL